MEIEKIDAVRIWMTDVMTENSGSERTKEAYLTYLNEFNEWVKNRYDGNVTWVIEKTVADWKMGQKPFAEELTKEYFLYLTSKERGLTRNSAKTHYGTLRSFFRANNIIFVGKTPSAVPDMGSGLPNKDLLIKAYKYADFEGKLRIGILSDTGLRPGDIIALTFGHVKESYNNREERAYFFERGHKRLVKFATCLSPMVTELLWKYLDTRKANGEELDDNSPLLTRSKYPGQAIGTNQLYRNVVEVGEMAGIKISPKTFRIRFNTYCTPIIGKEAVSRMASWKIPGVGESYSLPPKEETLRLHTLIEPTISLIEYTQPMALEIQRRTLYEIAKAMPGWDPDALIRKANIGDSVEKQIKFLTKAVVQGLTRNHAADPAREVANILKEALEYIKEGAS